MPVSNILRSQRLLAKIQKLKRYFQIHNIDQKHPRYERMRKLVQRYRNAITTNKDIQEEYGLDEAIYSDKPQKDYLRLTERGKELLKKKKKKDFETEKEDKRFIKKKKDEENRDEDEEENGKEDDSEKDDGNEDGGEKEQLSHKKEKIIINPLLKAKV